MSRPDLFSLDVIETAREALANLAEASRVDMEAQDGKVKIVAYWVGDVARVDIKLSQK